MPQQQPFPPPPQYGQRPGYPGGPPPPPPAAQGQQVSVAWQGSPWSLVGLSFANAIMTLGTLGIYAFWGRTEVRRRIWSSIRLDGEPLAYTGTGKELFLGFLFAMFVVFLPALLFIVAVTLYFGPNSPATQIATLILYAVFFLLVGIAVYRARHYRLSRTEWRGIRGGMSGSALAFSWHWIWTALLIPFTLGWIVPWRANRLQGHLARETTFGTEGFSYEGSSSRLYGPYALLWVGGILLYVGAFGAIFGLIYSDVLQAQQRGIPFQPSMVQIAAMVAIGIGAVTLLSLIGAWYASRQLNVFAAYTGFDRARLSLKTTAPGLVGLILSNLAITLLSLGILSPVAQARAARYVIERLSIDGSVDLAAIAQSKSAQGRGGEGLAQAFDAGAF